MNHQLKEAIILMRTGGNSYKNIAETLCISENTVKSYCRRNNMGGIASMPLGSDTAICCRHCGEIVKQTIGKKQRQYCSDKCRMAWWNAHPETLNQKSVRNFICQSCGCNFEGYGKRERKYCSHACYGKSKAVRHE